MKIAIRLEGGIGDHICASRFIPAIKELYPNAKFYGFSDTENNPEPSKFLKIFWPSLFENIYIIQNKKYENFSITSQFGTENFIGAFENIPDDITYHIINDYDKYYDLHIDGLKWLSYDFNWSKYFYTFPEPEISIQKLDLNNTICLNLYSDANKSNRMSIEYVLELVKTLSVYYNIIIIATEKNASFYEPCIPYAKIVFPTTLQLAEIIKSSVLFLTLDSGPKFLGYCLGTPTINYTAQINKYLELAYHQMIRWQPFVNSVLPLYNDISHTLSLINICIKYKTNILPSLPFDINNILIIRDYKINYAEIKSTNS